MLVFFFSYGKKKKKEVVPNFNYFPKYYLFDIVHFLFQYFSLAGETRVRRKRKGKRKRKRKEKEKNRLYTILTVTEPPLF